MNFLKGTKMFKVVGHKYCMSLKSETNVYFNLGKFSGWCSAKGQTGNCFTKWILINPPLCGFHNFTSLILSCTVRLYKVVMGWSAVYYDKISSEKSFGKHCFWKFLQQDPPRRRQHLVNKCRERMKTRLTYNCAHLRWTKESLTFEYDIWWYWVTQWVSRRRYWLVQGQ